MIIIVSYAQMISSMKKGMKIAGNVRRYSDIAAELHSTKNDTIDTVRL